ncbi:MAG TPA: GNAT family N-acetyltransferase [Ktedonobacteraceae bacterium]|jgi:putative acetyltransferase|nr:GNAT family N-acetyltransferase [Ktedonobacteraceae bacterium]
MGQTRITIRPLRLSDTEDMHEIMHMPNVLWGTAQLPSKSLEMWRKTIEGWLNDEHAHDFVAEIGGKVVGAIHLRVGEGRERHVGTISMVVHDAYQGQSIGKMLMLTVIDLADNWLNLLRLQLEVYTDNERAINLYKRFDFEIEGKKRCDGFRAGVYLDSYVMGRVRSQTQKSAPLSDYTAMFPPPARTPQAPDTPDGV